LIIYHSRPETQNTKKIAESMALAVKAELTSIDKVHEVNINDYDIVGFGSGVYFGRFGKTLIRYAKNLANQKQRAFIFYTCGAKSCDKTKNKFSQLLESKGRTVIGS
jgi:menaquinone-dependent protoporphyrinogen IX oxidase